MIARPARTPEVAEVMDAGDLDLRDYLQLLYKRRWLITSVTLLAVLASGILSFFVLPPVYSAQVILQVTSASAPPKVSSHDLQSIVDNLSSLPQVSLDSYVAQLTTPQVMQRVIDTLQLDRRGYTVDSLSKSVSARNVKGTNLIEVTVEGKEPKLAADIADAIGMQFAQFIGQNSQEQIDKSARVLQDQLSQANVDLQKAIGKLNQFQSQPEGVALLQEKLIGGIIDLGKYESRLRNASVEISLLQAGADQLGKALEQTPRTLPGQVSTRNGIWMQETNPTWVALSKKLAEKQVALAQSIAEEKALTEQVNRLETDIRGLQARLTTKQSEQAYLQAHVDRATSYRELVNQKIYEAKVASATRPVANNIQLVSPATVPSRPIKPHKALNLTVAGIVGLVASLFVVFILENLEARPVHRQEGSVGA